MSDMYRTRTMDQISEGDIGAQLKIAGWVENIRDHGGVSFIDLRDMYGVMQVVLRDTSLLDHVRKEECLSVEGVIQHRDEETFNPKIPTGTIELEAHKIDILGKVYRDLPFEIATSKEIREDVRLKYRYLDMRNRKVKDNIFYLSAYLLIHKTVWHLQDSAYKPCLLLVFLTFYSLRIYAFQSHKLLYMHNSQQQYP